jgi:prepilin-type N-terminal cleavage/methylation domain-containing protein
MKAMILNRKALRTNSKKGFTLVEVIVVLVILAILMAIAVPSLTGYIDKARDDSKIAQASSARAAVQMIVSEAYGHTDGTSGAHTYTYGTGDTVVFPKAWKGETTGTGSLKDAVNALTKGGFTDVTIDTMDETDLNQVVGLTVKIDANNTAKLSGDTWVLIKN